MGDTASGTAVRRLARVFLVVACAAGCSTTTASPATNVARSTTSTAPSTSRTSTTSTTSTTRVPSVSTTVGAPSTTSRPAPKERDFSAIDPIVARFVDEHGLAGAGLIVVERDDGVVYEGYWGSFTADRTSLVASSSKMVTAGVLMRLDDDGLLDIDAPVADAVEWGAGNPRITPAQLVSNSSGLVGLMPRPGYAPYRCQWDAGGDLQTCAAAIFTTLEDDADVIPPDTEFRYGGGQWQVAGGLAEAVSGSSWSDLIDEIYVGPCGLESTGYNNHWAQLGTVGFEYPEAFAADPSTLRPTANPNMEGGMYTTTGDYAKLLLMHLRDGRCDDEQVLSPAAIDRLHADRIGEVYGGWAGLDSGYGMGWWVELDGDRLTDAGAYGSTPWLDLADGYGAYLVIEADTMTGFDLSHQLFDAVDAAVTGR